MKWKARKMTKVYGRYKVTITETSFGFYAVVKETITQNFIYMGDVHGAQNSNEAADGIAKWLGVN